MVSDCTTYWGRALLPEHDEAERETAEATGALFASRTDVVCPYDPRPIVSDSTLMWRNENHLTTTYAQQLWTAMRAVVEEALMVDIGTDAASPDPEPETASALPAPAAILRRPDGPDGRHLNGRTKSG